MLVRAGRNLGSCVGFPFGRVMPRVWLGRCKDPTHAGCCLEEHHVGACNDGNVSEQEYEVECITAEKLVRKKRLFPRQVEGLARRGFHVAERGLAC